MRSLLGLGLFVCLAASTPAFQVSHWKLTGKPDLVAKDKYVYKRVSAKLEGICGVDGGSLKAWRPDGTRYPRLEKYLQGVAAKPGGPRFMSLMGKKIRYAIVQIPMGIPGQQIFIEGTGNTLAHDDKPRRTQESVSGELGKGYWIVQIDEAPSAKTTRIRLRVYEMHPLPLLLKCAVGAKGMLEKESYRIEAIGRANPGPKQLNPFLRLPVWYVKLTRPSLSSNLPDVMAGPGYQNGNLIDYADEHGKPTFYAPSPKGSKGSSFMSVKDQIATLPVRLTEIQRGKQVDKITCYSRIDPAIMERLVVNSTRTFFVDLTGIRLDPKP